MLRSIGKQSVESVESVRKKKREATVGRICRKHITQLLVVLSLVLCEVRVIPAVSLLDSRAQQWLVG